jgi:hypothetical protein
VLTVDILEALHLKHMDRRTHTTNPYVIAVLNDEAARTPAIRWEAARPVWNHRVFFETSRLLQSLELQLHHQHPEDASS